MRVYYIVSKQTDLHTRPYARLMDLNSDRCTFSRACDGPDVEAVDSIWRHITTAHLRIFLGSFDQLSRTIHWFALRYFDFTINWKGLNN